LIELVSRLPRSECARRFKEAVGSEWNVFGVSDVVLGSVTETSFNLWKLRFGPFPLWGIGFKCYLSGKLIDDGGATRVRCRFGLGWFSWGWFLVVTFLVLRGAFMNHTAIPLIFLLGFGAIVGFARFVQQYDYDFLIAFVRNKIDAA
jgi:hypothetical protein